ncbi:MAG: Clp protease N-terminal domain-containing protein [Anaerolineae bacterium]|nr:Clp protease N-terminal domain-containing protein [Anaerolineae bacterium]
MNHNYIGTEHLLLGLMREEGGVAGRVLRDLGLDQDRVEDGGTHDAGRAAHGQQARPLTGDQARPGVCR